jgi:UDP-N-acetylmuramoylalanine--D-glutamate ligase
LFFSNAANGIISLCKNKEKRGNMNYTIIGAARSGLASARLAKSLGNGNVFLTEFKPESDFSETASELKKLGVECEFGGNTERALETDLIITSPGVLPSTWIISEADRRGIKIISEMEFGSQYIHNPIIAITGTNGKTTTTTLTAYMLKQAGRTAVTAGNIGTPICELVGEVSDDTIIVAEVSSFQLDRVDTFKPQVAMILNITPDHLYYHSTMENYSLAKWKISSRQSQKDLLILNADDEGILKSLRPTNAQTAWFSMSSLGENVNRGIYNRDGRMILKMQNKEEEIMLFDEIRLPGVHNAYNSMAAILAVRAFEIKNENIRDSLVAFEGVEHRLEYVRSLDGVEYVNDSKATNVNATWYALSSYKSPIVWIAGGRGDNNDYSQLDNLVRKNVKCIVAMGEEADAIFNHFSTMVRCIKVHSMEDAVDSARVNAEPGDIALFTPACKSFDMFMNYEHRGEVFKEVVNDLV